MWRKPCPLHPRKARFGTESSAVTELAKRMRRPYRFRFLRVYECPGCGGWHLTKQRKRNP